MSERTPARMAQERVVSGTLSNGVTWVVWPDVRDTVCSCEVWVRTGSAHEDPTATGLAHMLEHLMFRGTTNVPDGAFDAEMDRMGAMINASTWLDYTAYSSSFPPDHVRRVLELEADRFQNLAITPAVFTAERDVVANERRQTVEADPLARLGEAIARQVWGASAYGWPTIGTSEHIADYTRDAIEAFWRTRYTPERICVCLAGPIVAAHVVPWLEATFGQLHRSPSDMAEPEITERPGETRTLRLPVRAPRLHLAWVGPGRLDPTWPAWMLVRELLAGSESSRLPRRLEIDEPLALDSGAWWSGHARANTFDIELTPRSGVTVDRLRDCAMKEIRRLATDGPGEAEIGGTLRRMRRYEVSRLCSTSGRCEALGSSWIHSGSPLRGLDLFDQLERLTPDDVQQVARRMVDGPAPHCLIAIPDRAETPCA
jgi:zinc protease